MSAKKSAERTGEVITKWARRLASFAEDASAVLDETARRLSVLDFEIATTLDFGGRATARRLLLERGAAPVHAIALEATLDPQAGANFPLFVAAFVRFRMALAREMLCEQFLTDPDLERVLRGRDVLHRRTIVFSELATPPTFVEEIQISGWPLLELVDSATIEQRVVSQLRLWTFAGRHRSRTRSTP